MNEATFSSQLWHPLPEWFRRLASQECGSVLLETARFDAENYRTFLFRHPVEELIAHTIEDIPGILHQIDLHVEQGRYVAGFVSYECGEVFQDLATLSERNRSSPPLIRMGVFGTPQVFDHRSGIANGGMSSPLVEVGEDDANVHMEDVVLQITEQAYAKKISRIQEYLAAGDSYQVNFTDRVSGTFTGTPIALYRGLLQGQPVSYAAFMDCGAYQVLSFSPELFYRTKNCSITVRPMKGTWPRGATLEDDEQAALNLQSDEKNRAEHVMIVDLLRNDLGKICRMGSVKVDRLMQVELYRTLLQLTSTITGTLDAGKSPTQRFAALFPSGSITGAPKRRTMEIIRELEESPRDIYTGAVGWMGPNGDSCFNVAIRTLQIEGQHFTLGVGGGITAYSDVDTEYEECKLKASFLERLAQEFRLIETMRADGNVVKLLTAHLKRLERSALYFQIPFDEKYLRREIAGCLRAPSNAQTRLRLTLDEQGRVNIATAPLEPDTWSGQVLLSSSRTKASDVFLKHKTTRRTLYNTALSNARMNSFDEVLFVNEHGMVTEGAISNIFLRMGGFIVTPDLASGLLPGVFRQSLLDKLPAVQTRPIHLKELLAAEQIWFCNAVRGCRTVQKIRDEQGSVLWIQSLDGTDDLSK